MNPEAPDQRVSAIPPPPLTAGDAAASSGAPAEMSVRVMRMLTQYFERNYGRERLLKVLRDIKYPLSLDYFAEANNFVSFAATEQLQDALAEASGDPAFVAKAAAETVTPESMGFAYHILRAVGSPKMAYRKVFEITPLMNRAGRFDVQLMTDTEMVFEYRSFVTEHNRNFCIGRLAQFTAIPTVWSLPPALGRELQCQLNGAPSCKYHLTWSPSGRSFRRYVGAILGLAMGLVLGVALSQSVLAWGGGLTLFFAVLGAWLDVRVDVKRKDDGIQSQHEGMVRSLADLQHRYEELNQANARLEQRVEERTHELSDANEKLKVSLDSQRELDRMKAEFFDNVSHELRTPLTLILLSLEALSLKFAGELSPRVLEYLQTMDRSAARLLRLINQLLDLAKLEAGKTRLRYEPVEVYGFVKTLLLPFQLVALERGVKLEVEGQPAGPVHVDSEKLDIVFQNLITNALKFTAKGGSVTVRVAESAETLQVEIADTGIGIASEDIKHLFNRFSQADAGGKRRFGGTGIGLALVRETVEIHGGTVTVESKVGEGSSFFVTLPKGTAHIRDDLRERRSLEIPVLRDRRGGADGLTDFVPRTSSLSGLPAQEPRSDHGTGAPLGAKRILVVEDDADMRSYITSILWEQYRVVTAEDGEDGLSKTLTEAPDLVISDLMMPKMSGLEMIRRLREHGETTDTPIILLTARREAEAAADGLSIGANDYMGKPFSPRELLARVDAQIRLRDAATRIAEKERLATLGMLTAGFAHEVRNPLNGFLNLMDPLRKCFKGSSEEETGKELLKMVEECGNRVKHLADALLSFAPTDNQLSAVDVSASMDASLRVFSWRIPAGVAVVRKLADGAFVKGSVGELNQVWTNLLDNALRAVGDHGQVVLETRREGDKLVVSVEDTGEGISRENLDRIFEPFFSTRKPGEGTGLGLALCRRIILRYAGTLTVRSVPGKGSCFTVVLPLVETAAFIADSPADRVRRALA